MGKIITFYSYKGGTGRSMALANVAYLLSTWGYKVLMVDWDLEAPGLEYFFRNFLDTEKVTSFPGVIDILTQIQEAKGTPSYFLKRWKKYLVKISLPNSEAKLDLLTAGNRNQAYFQRIRSLDIKSIYSDSSGGNAIEALRNQWKENYDFVLIDSRTGITDIGGICTIQMPDILVLMFTATDQAIDGVVKVAERAYEAQKHLLSDRLRLISIPIASRFDSKEEFKLSQSWLRIFANKLSSIYSNWLPTSVKPIQILEATRIPYSAYFSFGEKLPVIEQSRLDSGGLTFAYENISALIANEMENVELLVEDRDGFIKKASVSRKRKSEARQNIFISYSHKDTRYADQLLTYLKVLRNKGINLNIWDDTKITAGHDWYKEINTAVSESSIIILLVSSDYLVSKYIMNEELPRILQREAEDKLKIIPLILRPCLWESVSLLKNLQVYPKNGRPLTTLPKIDQEIALVDFANQILLDLDLSTELEDVPDRIQNDANTFTKKNMEHELALARSRHEFELKTVKWELYQPLIRKSLWDVLALQLAEHPEDFALISDMIRRQRNKDLENQLSTLRIELKENTFDEHQLEEEAKNILQKLTEILDRQNANTMTDKESGEDFPTTNKKRD